MMDFDFYEDVDAKIEWEGLDYYVQHYADPDHFNGDPAMREALLRARLHLNEFEMLLEQRLEETSMGTDIEVISSEGEIEVE